ncbi:hypothetical protein [Azospirillum brasilense]|nr:hypothetical protein [Azospirillum brasilense]
MRGIIRGLDELTNASETISASHAAQARAELLKLKNHLAHHAAALHTSGLSEEEQLFVDHLYSIALKVDVNEYAYIESESEAIGTDDGKTRENEIENAVKAFCNQDNILAHFPP